MRERTRQKRLASCAPILFSEPHVLLSSKKLKICQVFLRESNVFFYPELSLLFSLSSTSSIWGSSNGGGNSNDSSSNDGGRDNDGDSNIDSSDSCSLSQVPLAATTVSTVVAVAACCYHYSSRAESLLIEKKVLRIFLSKKILSQTCNYLVFRSLDQVRKSWGRI